MNRKPLVFLDGSRTTVVGYAAGEAGPPTYRAWDTRFDLSARLPAFFDELLTAAGTHLDDLGTLAVGVGPGSLTGLRVVVAFMRTLAQMRNLPLIGVDRFSWAAVALTHQNVTGRVRLVVPAFSGQYYIRDMTLGADRATHDHSTPALQTPDTLGADGLPVWVVDGEPTFSGAAGCIAPDAAALAALLEVAAPEPILQVAPLYVVPSQAELTWMQKHGHTQPLPEAVRK